MNKLTHFLLGRIVVFIWMVQHAHAPVGCFYFIFISLKYNFVASDYNWNIFIASFIWKRLYLPLFGHSKLRNNRLLHLRLLPPFWNETAANFFKIAGLYFLAMFALIGWYLSTHPQLLPNLEKRVTLSERCRFLCFQQYFCTILRWELVEFPENFPFCKKLFRSCWQHEQFSGVKPWGMV